MITRCEKCKGYYLVKMETAMNPVTGKMGYIKCADKNCGHTHDWPYKK